MDETALGGAIGGMAGSLIGQMQAQGNYQAIQKLRDEAMKLYGDISIPTLEKLAQSKLNGVSMDQKYKGTQDAALAKLMGIANADGMDAQSEAKLNEAKQQAFGVQRGMQGAADQMLERRGMASTGSAITSAQGAAQAGIDRENQGAIQTASDASERALQALMAGGNMARGMGQDDLAQKNRAASADDRIAEFNSGLAGQKFKMEMEKANALNNVMGDKVGDNYEAASRQKREAEAIGAAGGGVAGNLYGRANGAMSSDSTRPPPPPAYEDEWQDPYKRKDPNDPNWSK